MNVSLNVRTVTAGAFAGIVILLTLMLGSAISAKTTRSMEETIGSSLSEVAYQMSEKLDHFMWARAGEINVLSKLNAFQPPLDPAEVSSLLNELKTSMPVFTWVGYLDAEGNVSASTDDILLGANIRERPVFAEGRKGPFIGDVHDAVLLSKLLPNPTGEPLQFVDYSVPVQDAEGRLTGVLAAHFSWEWSSEVEQSIIVPMKKHTKGVEVFIVSAIDDTILLGPDHLLGQRMEGEVLQAAREKDYGWMIESTGGDGYLTGYSYGNGYLDYPGLGWTVMIRQPEEIAFASVSEMQKYILTFGLLAAILFGIAGWFVAGWISRPLQRIAEAADRLRFGEKVEVPRFRAFKEMEVLTDSLRNLVSNWTQAEHALVHMSDRARHDALTGLPNRVAMEEYMALAVNKAKLNQSTLSFLYLDLDGFKKVNDTLGHIIGDKLLQQVAVRLVGCTRDNELVARLGGDEFVVILHTTSIKPAQEAEIVAKRIIARLNEPFEVEGHAITVGCSIGAAVWSPDGPDPSECLRLADDALYLSKRSGKNRMTFEAGG